MADRKRRSEKTSAKATAKIHTQTLKSRRILTEEQAEIEFDAEIFETEPAYIRIGHGVTKSIADYESLRIEVSLTVPCYMELIPEVAADCGERVAQILEDELDEYGIDLHGDNK